MGNKITKKALTLRKLPSKDLILQITSIKAKKILIGNIKWLKSVFGARVQVKTYLVIIYGVKKTAVKPGSEQEAVGSLKKQNTLFYLRFKIHKAAWPKAAIQSNKTYGLIILELSSAKEANLVIKKGLIKGYDIKTCELFDKNCKIIQYFNCQRYNYIKKAYKKRIACGFCTRNHNTKNYETKKDQSKKNCVIYKSKGYEAWSSHCPVKKEKEKKSKKNAF